MRSFTFTPADVAAIAHDRYHHPHPRVQQKMQVLWLKSRGESHTAIARLAGLARRTVQRILDEFHAGGLAEIRRVKWRGQPAALDAHAASLEDHFLANPARSAAEAQAAIARLTGVRRGLTQVRRFLKKLSACGGGSAGPSRPRPTPPPRPRSSPTAWGRG